MIPRRVRRFDVHALVRDEPGLLASVLAELSRTDYACAYSRMTIAGGAANIWLVVETSSKGSEADLQEVVARALPKNRAAGVWVVARPANRRPPCGSTAWFMARTGVLEDDIDHMVDIATFLADRGFNVLESEMFVGRDREMIAQFNVALGAKDPDAQCLRVAVDEYISSTDNRWEWDSVLEVNSDPHPLVDAFRD